MLQPEIDTKAVSCLNAIIMYLFRKLIRRMDDKADEILPGRVLRHRRSAKLSLLDSPRQYELQSVVSVLLRIQEFRKLNLLCSEINLPA